MIKNPDILRSDVNRVHKHLQKLEGIFEMVKELCAFNEAEIPSDLEYLKIQWDLQDFFLNKRKEDGKVAMSELVRLFERVDKIDEKKFVGKREQVGHLYYETSELSACKENWKDYAANYMEWGPMLSNEIVAEGALSIFYERYDRDLGNHLLPCFILDLILFIFLHRSSLDIPNRICWQICLAHCKSSSFHASRC